MTILEVVALRKLFPIRKGLLRRIVGQVRAVDGVNFRIEKGETLSLVGESGCGKTTVSRCIVRALQPSAGAIRFRVGDGGAVDIAQVPKRALKPFRRHMQMIFQDPFSSLNPRMMIGDIIGRPLLVNGMKNKAERRERVEELLGLVHLPAAYMNRFPHACSGGQRPRIRLARAPAPDPRPVLPAKPVSAPHASVPG